jgi:hypothetical protein
MSLDRELVESIKVRFARRSSADLQEIVQSDDRERWSPEAVAAAGEVLDDRRAGRAEEPDVPEEEPAPPPIHYEAGDLALVLLAPILSGILSGGHLIVLPRPRQVEVAPADVPVKFGPRMAWLAVDTTDTEAVATALRLGDVRPATWADGIGAAYESSVFVTPPLGDWTLAVGTPFFPPERPESFVKALLEPLSARFGEAQYFCTHSDIDLHLWAKARNARTLRGFGWLGQKRLTLWDEGKQTKAERDLGIRLSDDRFSAAPQAADTDAAVPSEETVMRLASFWSIDPTSLDEQMMEPVTGLLGTAAWADTRITRSS